MPLVRLSDEEEPAPNLAPMIDVVLVLTIFFMCATKFSGDERKFDLELPQAEAAAITGGRPEIVEVDEGGGLRLGGAEVAIDELAGRLAELRAAEPDLAVLIRGAKTVAHGRMAEVYEACRVADVRQVGISVQPRSDTKRR
jgi:biopolymer transport protein ExbD